MLGLYSVNDRYWFALQESLIDILLVTLVGGENVDGCRLLQKRLG